MKRHPLAKALISKINDGSLALNRETTVADVATALNTTPAKMGSVKFKKNLLRVALAAQREKKVAADIAFVNKLASLKERFPKLQVKSLVRDGKRCLLMILENADG